MSPERETAIRQATETRGAITAVHAMDLLTEIDRLRTELSTERERCAKIAVKRSCSWTEADDKRSKDYREGIEDAASQIAAAIRAGT